MPDDTLDLDDAADTGDQGTGDTPPSKLRKAHDDAVQRASEAEARAVAAERKAAFVEAGIDLTKPLAQTLMGVYSGDLDAKAVQEYITTQGATTIFREGAVPTIDPGDGSTDERQALAHGAAPPTGQDPVHPFDAGRKAFDDAVAAGSRREDAVGEWYGRVFGAASAGDQRVLVERKGGD